VAGKLSRTFKAELVESLIIGNIQLAAGRICGHIEKRCAYVRKSGGLYKRVRIHGKYVFIGKSETNRTVPVAMKLIFPVSSGRC